MSIKEFNIPIYINKRERAEGCYTLILLESGCGTVVINGRGEFISSPGLLSLNSQEMWSIEGDIDYTIMDFLPEFISPRLKTTWLEERRDIMSLDNMDIYWLQPFLKREEFTGYITLDSRELYEIKKEFNSVRKEIEDKRDEYWPCRTRSIFMKLIFMLESLEIEKNSKPKISEAIILYIHKNYEREITIQLLAEEFALNRTSLTEKFKEETGQTIISYLNSVRVQMAVKLIKETYLSITEIMFRAGFNTAANFNRRFKEIYGITPRELKSSLGK